MTQLTIKQLFEIEPELERLDLKIRHLPIIKRTDPYRWWYGPYGFKDDVIRLAGWEAQKQELRTMEAYDLAYNHYYDLLRKRCWNPRKSPWNLPTKYYSPIEPGINLVRFDSIVAEATGKAVRA